MGATIRTATTDETEEIVALAEHVWRVTYDEILTSETIDAAIAEWYDPEQTREAIESEDVTYYIAQKNDEIVGYVSGHRQDDVGQLGALYVHPEYWGEKIGSILLERFEMFCRAGGCETTEAEVLAENDVGQSFYRMHGFEVVDEQEVELFGETVREQTLSRLLT